MSTDVVMAALITVMLGEIAIGYAIAIAAETWKRRKKGLRVLLSMVRHNSPAGRRQRGDMPPLRVAGGTR